MKFILAIFFLILSIPSIGQTESKYKWLLDSSEINVSKDFFDVRIIDIIRIVKDSSSGINNCYLTTKKTIKYKFISLTEAAKEYIISSQNSYIFMVDNQFLKEDIKSYRIDSLYVLKIGILKGNEFASLVNQYSGLTIIQIKTKSDENLKEEQKIHLRGTEIIKE